MPQTSLGLLPSRPRSPCRVVREQAFSRLRVSIVSATSVWAPSRPSWVLERTEPSTAPTGGNLASEDLDSASDSHQNRSRVPSVAGETGLPGPCDSGGNGSLIVLVGLALALGLVDALATHRGPPPAQLRPSRSLQQHYEGRPESYARGAELRAEPPRRRRESSINGSIPTAGSTRSKSS